MKNKDWQKCLICSDSRNVIKRIPDKSIDLILTDPPYNLAQHSTGNIPLPGRTPMNNNVADWDLIDFNPEEWADEFIRILKPSGNLFIFTSYNQIGKWYNCLDHRFDTSNFMVWHKTNPAPKIFKAGFLNSCELIFTCWNKKHTWNFISQAEMHNFLETPICMRPERLSDPKHPTQKPVAILKKIIQIASNKNDIVFDPFMGVGSTGVAATDLERRFIGVEIDKTYFNAAKKRIEQELTTKGKMTKTDFYINSDKKSAVVREDIVAYQNNLFDLDIFFGNENINIKKDTQDSYTQYNQPTGLQPIIKWPGGKEKELKYILPNMPEFNRFFEPFVGGGSVFMGINAKEYYINDFSSELIMLYDCISTSNKDFFRFAEMMDCSWKKSQLFFKNNIVLLEIYINYRNGRLTKDELKKQISSFCKERKDEINEIIGSEFASYPCILQKEMITNLFRKMSRMRDLETVKHQLPIEDLHDNIETAIKSSIYMNYRNMFNDCTITKTNPTLHCALFFFIRNYAYSGMFRYSSKGDFNVPYGGIAYNSKLLSKKLKYYRSEDLLKHFSNTHIFNLDFELFLRKADPNENDFVFLDPPYDSEFNTYAQNAFTKEDQQRLANYMIYECKAKWMLIIKYTEFIYSLYNRDGINIRTFDKEYLVSFMNRNNKKVTHLLITNY